MNLKQLRTKFALLLLLVFVIGSSIGGIVLSNLLQQRVERQFALEGQLLMESLISVRAYTTQNIAPLLAANLDPDQFAKEAIPAYSARRVVEKLRENPDFADFSYKEAVLDPSNPLDLADDFEQSLIENFQKKTSLKQVSGFSQQSKEKYFYSARPIQITDANCLQCHGSPAAAPKSMLEIYGKDNGFNWPLNTVLGTQIIYVPARNLADSAKQAFISVVGVFIAVFAIAIVLLNRLLKPTVLHPIQYLARLSQRLSADAEFVKEYEKDHGVKQLDQVAVRQDEIGQLANIFRKMVDDVVAREKTLRAQIATLSIEIDEAKRAKQVKEVTDTDYFRDLQKRAKDMRNRRSKED